MSLFPDLLDLLQEFDAAEVEYLLVGGHAVALHGRPRFTKDADLWIRDTPDNFARLERALASFGTSPSLATALADAAPTDVVWMVSTHPNRPRQVGARQRLRGCLGSS
jgi:hypothetical protein